MFHHPCWMPIQKVLKQNKVRLAICTAAKSFLQLDPSSTRSLHMHWHYIRTSSQKTFFFNNFRFLAPPQQASDSQKVQFCHNVTIPHHSDNILPWNTKARGQKPGIVGFPASVATSSSPSLLALRCPPSVGLGHKSTHQGLYPAENFQMELFQPTSNFSKIKAQLLSVSCCSFEEKHETEIEESVSHLEFF